MSKPIVAVVGSPNVGKSTIFNRLIGERHAIVDDEAGITRDRLYGNVEWLSHKFAIIDTGGVELKNKPFQEQIRVQVQIAIDEADLIVFVVDGQVGISNDDIMVAKMLRNVKKPVILVANKIDSYNQIANAHEFYALGLGEPISVSGSHGVGIGDLLNAIIAELPENDEELEEETITFCLVGRPNFGKSSLANAILNQ